MIIDFHAHYFPDSVAAAAITHIEGISGFQAFADGGRSGLLDSMDKAGIDISVNLPVATDPAQVAGINRKMAAARDDGRIIDFGAFHPAVENPVEVLEDIAASGLPGVKTHPEYQAFRPGAEEYDDIWAACADLGLIVVFHAGADFAFKPPFKSDPAQFAAIIRRHPGLKMVLAHFGSWNMWDEVESRLAGLPLYFDLSFSLDFIEPERAVALIRLHGADRVLFGSDTPWRCQADTLRLFNALPLDEAERSAILGGNAIGLLGL